MIAQCVSGTLAVLLVAGAATHASEAQVPPEFPADVEALLEHWAAPGATLSVVRRGEALFVGGFGTTRVEGGSPVDGHTLTSVASVTKAFNAVALGMLVDEGALGWDDPVKQHIPELEFAGPFVSGHLTIRDLLAHRSGLPALVGSSFWGEDDVTMDALLQFLTGATPRIPFRDRLDYSQVGIALTGEVVRRVTGESWPVFVQKRILEPLGMDATHPGSAAFLRRHPDPAAVANLMGRAVRRDGSVVDAPWQGAKEVYAPAGGLVTTAEDMTKFMLFLLDGGRVGGRQLLAEATIRDMYVPHLLETTEWGPVTNPLARLVAYGLGWYVHEYEGRLVVEHGGANAGSSVVALLPEEGVGVFVSTGATWPTDSNRLVSALKFLAVDMALGLDRKDWARVHGAVDGRR